MTVSQMIYLCRKHGHALFCRPDGTPVVKKMRDDAVLPNDLQQTLLDSRAAIVEWFVGKTRQEWEVCTTCKADVHRSLTPLDAWILCGRVETKKTMKCPYRETN